MFPAIEPYSNQDYVGRYFTNTNDLLAWTFNNVPSDLSYEPSGFCYSANKNVGNYNRFSITLFILGDNSDLPEGRIRTIGSLDLIRIDDALYTTNSATVWNVANQDANYCTQIDIFNNNSGGSGGIPAEYSQFWFPVVSIVAFCAIIALVYKIIIKRLMP